MCALYIYNGGTIWWSIYRIPIGHMSATYEWLLMYTIYTVDDATAYIHILKMIITHTILLLVTNKNKKKKQNNLHAVSGYECAFYYLPETIYVCCAVSNCLHCLLLPRTFTV